jgi:DNA-binding XRE family transcriptional regulator
MTRRVVELEIEVVDWLDQLPTASFATAVFFIGLLRLQGALLAGPHTAQLGGKVSRLRELRFFLGLEPAGITYWFAPGRRLVLLTVLRDNHVPRRHEVDRARDALRRCGPHGQGPHVSWSGLRDPRMGDPGAAEIYDVTRLSYEIGRAVRRVRERRRLTTRALAEAAQTSESSVARCEAGGMSPTAPVAQRIARALDCEHLVSLPDHPAWTGAGRGGPRRW